MSTSDAHSSSHSTPKSVFLHLLMIAMLYISVISGIQLLFQYVDVAFPDQLTFHRSSVYDAVRWSSSILLVAYPVFVYLSWLLAREFTRHTQLRQVQIRRWLLDFTLFITALTVIIDLISAIYRFYGGELTVSFALKVLVVLLIAVAVFAYYRWELKRPDTHTNLPRNAAVVAGAIVLVSIVGGLFVFGTPAEQRKYRFDEQRVSDLQSIQYQVLYYWQQKDVLPQTIEALRNELTGFVAPTDPETEVSYEYNVKADLTFELCATFSAEGVTDDTTFGVTDSRVSPAVPLRGYEDTYTTEVWEHPAGRYCFERTVDPDYFDVTPVKGGL